MEYQYLPVDRVHYGINVVKESLSGELKRLNAQRVLLVTTNSLKHTRLFSNLAGMLEGKQMLSVCSKQHVPGDVLEENLEAIRGFAPDVMISFGGGSAIDAAKIISLALAEGIKTEEELFQYSVNAGRKKAQMDGNVPHLAIPTTLSAAEFTCIAGVTYSGSKAKHVFFQTHLTPKQVFLDPVYTMDTPLWLWLSTGMRAVDHAVETLYSPRRNPVNACLALRALKLLYEHLPLCKEEPDHLEHRLNCQIGAWMSLFSNINIKLGLSHSIGHQLGAKYDIPHGITSAIMLPHVMRFLLPQTHREQAQITEVLGCAREGMSLQERAEKAPDLIGGLVDALEIPHRLRDFNVPKDGFQEVVNDILMDIEGEKNTLMLGIDGLKEKLSALLENAW